MAKTPGGGGGGRRHKPPPKMERAGYAPRPTPRGFGEPGFRPRRPPQPSVASALIPPRPQMPTTPAATAPLAPQSGPYQGAAGSEFQNPGRARQPLPDWADPASANYERRNYYISPSGEIIAREPGYYNPENPWDTGRPAEVNEEFGKWDPSAERRMDEPGVTPWGPGGKASPASAFPSVGPGAGTVQRPHGLDLARSLLTGGETSPALPGMGVDPNEELMVALAGLLGRVPGRNRRGVAA